jgi:hypothetical protein
MVGLHACELQHEFDSGAREPALDLMMAECNVPVKAFVEYGVAL